MYIDLLRIAHADERSPYELDSAEVATLQLLVEERYDRVGNWAGNLLCAIYGICRPPYTGGDEEAPKARRVPAELPRTPAAATHSLKVAPNPASSAATLGFELPGNTGVVHLLVRDLHGRVIRRFASGGAQGQVQWDARQAAPGVYSVSLIQDGRVIETQRLVVQP